MELSKNEFFMVRKHIHDISGIHIHENKEYLVKQRFEPIIKQYNLKGYYELCEMMKKPPAGFLEKVIIAITTNETSFFRDDGPFVTFEKVILPKLVSKIIERRNKAIIRKGPKVKIWCVASSTGQEPYSLAMLINEYCEKNTSISLDEFSILATDINTEVLTQAMQGKYNSLEVKRGLDETRLKKYFSQEVDKWQISSKLQSIVEYKKLNLANSFLSLGGFDLVLCRNVLIYFNDEMKKRILNEIYQLLPVDGLMILGSTENTYGLCEKFQSKYFDKTLVFNKA